ncbi:MAG TPA: hypothetical protein VFX86_04100 [Candidatus Saccharimonadales bacterium]|nr:hypothetical protein [Candidatus Saccharimonadales bacterium]
MNPSDNSTNKDVHNKDEFEQVVDKVRSANNVLVTISTDPTVDQFAACIGLTLVLNKVGKHANAVFSGRVPSALDFLKPEKTLEKNTDSLRDFIIALDKSKADKLRYKVENDVVKIFITPYKTSITEKDLEFSQGDLNVDVVVALGVQDKNHIDKAILSHGRILHDATVISINTSKHSKVGSLNWSDNRASSLCEMVADIASELDSNIFDSQNATALLTGIVAETDRYSNDKAAPHTMSVAGLLMSAGASTQLVSSELASGPAQTTSEPAQEQPDGSDGGVLRIDHPKQADNQPVELEEIQPPPQEPEEKSEPAGSGTDELPPPPVEPIEPAEPEAPTDVGPTTGPDKLEEGENDTKATISKPKVIHEPPEFSGKLTANSTPEEGQYTGSTDPLSSNLPDTPLLSRSRSGDAATDTLFPENDDSGLAKGKDLSIEDTQTLSEIEKSVDSPHLDDQSNDTTGPSEPNSSGSTDPGGGNDTPPESATLDPKKNLPPPQTPPPYLPPTDS